MLGRVRAVLLVPQRRLQRLDVAVEAHESIQASEGSKPTLPSSIGSPRPIRELAQPRHRHVERGRPRIRLGFRTHASTRRCLSMPRPPKATSAFASSSGRFCALPWIGSDARRGVSTKPPRVWMRSGHGHAGPASGGGAIRWSSMMRRTNSVSISARARARTSSRRSAGWCRSCRRTGARAARRRRSQAGIVRPVVEASTLRRRRHPDHVPHFLGVETRDHACGPLEELPRGREVAGQDSGLRLEREAHALHGGRQDHLLADCACAPRETAPRRLRRSRALPARAASRAAPWR